MSKELVSQLGAVVPYLIISSIEKQFKRLNKHKDPVIRYSLFLEMLRSVIETAVDASENSLQEAIYTQKTTEIQNNPQDPENTKKMSEQLRSIELLNKTYLSVGNLKKELETYFDNFSDWISQPIYSPDHPLGNNMMKEAEEDHSKQRESRNGGHCI